LLLITRTAVIANGKDSWRSPLGKSLVYSNSMILQLIPQETPVYCSACQIG
jgi:hypothetical protein